MEKKIGDEFYCRGVKLKVVEHKGCKGCHFLNRKYGCEGWKFALGNCTHRNDGRTVIFVKANDMEQEKKLKRNLQSPKAGGSTAWRTGRLY